MQSFVHMVEKFMQYYRACVLHLRGDLEKDASTTGSSIASPLRVWFISPVSCFVADALLTLVFRLGFPSLAVLQISLLSKKLQLQLRYVASICLCHGVCSAEEESEPPLLCPHIHVSL